MESWFKTARDKLLVRENASINFRLCAWKNAINKSTAEIANIFATKPTFKLKPFAINVTTSDMNDILSLIYEWKGLNTHLMSNVKDLTWKVYEHKANNWLNGNRAIHYSRVLYPLMINIAETYATKIAQQIFDERKCTDLFINACMYSYLRELCSIRLRVSEGGRRVFLLCDNSIANKKNQTNLSLQKYANNHKYTDLFPLHRQDAIDFFHKEKHNAIAALLVVLQEIQLSKINVLAQPQDLFIVINFIRQKCKTSDGKEVIIGKTILNAINTTVRNSQSNIQNNANIINNLKARIVCLSTQSRNALESAGNGSNTNFVPSGVRISNQQKPNHNTMSNIQSNATNITNFDCYGDRFGMAIDDIGDDDLWHQDFDHENTVYNII